MAYTTINKSTDYFNTKLFTGTGNSNAVTGVGFQPDLTWIKNRSNTDSHSLYDAVRGVTKRLKSDSAGAETTQSNGLTAFGTDGFTVGDHSGVNGSGNAIVSWNWKAGGGQGSSNTDGSINTTYTSVNSTAGFSISKWNGNGSSSATIGHGLGVIPKVIISKAISTSAPEGGWFVMHNSIADGENLRLNQTHGQYSTSQFSQGLIKESSATNSVWGFQAGGGVENVNSNGHTYITYCFAEKRGYSHFNSYIGNGSNDGVFCYTGMKPKFIMTKRINSSGTNWYMWDTSRDIDNPAEKTLFADNSNAEDDYSAYPHDILSNGFKVRSNNSAFNGSGDTYIYMAFGQSLVGSNNIPCTAR